VSDFEPAGIDELVANNQAYTADFHQGGRPVAPARRLIVVCCMDSRIDVFAALGLELGEAHILRNAGGIVTDDTLRSILISQRLLGTAGVVVIHHTDCGMVKFTDDELADAVERESGSRPPFPLLAFTDLDGSVRESVERIRTSPYIPHRDAVRGFVFDVDTGALREVS
jgi:carbonic anhydrase